MNSLPYNIHYEWKVIHDGVGRTPNIRASSCSWCYNNSLWLICGASSGVGKASEVWKFDLRQKYWHKIDTPDPAPNGRDGQSGAYIGNGKFVIFGGQGFPEPNQKLGKESEQMKTQTYWKREVFNDLWQFDCNSLKWTPIYPDGLSFPMGRRGSSCVYVQYLSHTLSANSGVLLAGGRGNSRQSSLGNNPKSGVFDTEHDSTSHISPSVNSSRSTEHHQRFRDRSTASNNVLHDAVSNPNLNTFSPLENCLVVFGGAGIELSKYTEQLYNDLWVFSFDRNIWTRYEAKGIDPIPVADHKVYKLENLMVIIGGILDTTPKVGSKDQQNPIFSSDIQVLNLMTMTWSFLPIYDSIMREKSIKLNLHGFSVFPDQAYPVSSNVLPQNQKKAANGPPALSATSVSQLIIFGGNQVLDTKSAIMSKTMKPLKERSSQEATLFFNIGECSISPVLLRGDIFPENRYQHVGVSSTPSNVELNEANTQQQIESDILSVQSHATLSSSNKKQSESTRKSFLPGIGGIDLRTEEVVSYVFGGSNIEFGGYCDPVLYALVRVKMIDPLQLRTNSAPVVASSNPTNSRQAQKQSQQTSQAQKTAKTVLQPFSTVHASPDSSFSEGGLRDDELDFLSSDHKPYDEDHNLQTSSIWVNIQNKSNSYRTKRIRSPNNWEEVKLSLTYSRSQRTLESSNGPHSQTLNISNSLKNIIGNKERVTNKFNASESFPKSTLSRSLKSGGGNRVSSRQRQEENERKVREMHESKAFPFLQKYNSNSHETTENRMSRSQLLMEYKRKFVR